MGDFSKEYDKLNAEQKKAVDQIEGAVLVIAGPGTGKTQLLSLRVANILEKSDSLAQNILCLTFTNKASNNMQLRLSRLVGPLAHKVMINTFHSFAAEVMNLYPEYFWQGARLTNVPTAVQYEIITDILSALPLDNPLALKFAGQFTSTKDVLDGLKLTKEAGLTPNKLRALITHNISYIDEIEETLVEICSERLSYKKLDELAMQIEELPAQHTDEVTRPLVALSTVILESFEAAHTADDSTGKTKNTSAWKSRWVKSVEGQKGMFEERKRNAWWLALADVYESYRGALHARGYYDFSDMIIEVISQLEQNPDMLADIQERFHYVLIDEFQDTNAAQLRLAHLVADNYASEGNPNIMAVGDDDQSIYKFNGAELSNMMGFTRSYPKAKTFVLTDNYRSSQDVLDISMQVIAQASERVTTKHAAITKELVAKNSPDKKSNIQHLSYPTKEHEYYQLAGEISKAQKQGTVAVLARGHDSLRSIAHTLNLQNVPVRYEQQQSVLEQPIVKQISLISEIIIAIADGNENLVNTFIPELLTYEAWQVKPNTLWELAIGNRGKAHWLKTLTDHEDEHLQTIGLWLLWLAGKAKTEPLSRVLEYIIGLSASEHLTSPLRRFYLEADVVDTPYLASISAVRKLTNLAQEFSNHGSATVQDFVRLLHVSRNNNQTITDQSLFVTAVNAVELLTIHKAKGLEFDSVFIIDAMESSWKPSARGRKAPSNLPLRPNGDDYDDYVRLMFVAMTRAKRDIIISSYYTTENGDEAVASSIIRDIIPATVLAFNETTNATAVLETSLTWPRLEGSEEKVLLKEILDNYTLSPSAFLDFLDIAKGGPQYFLEKYLLRLPEAQSVPAAFGSSIHTALERAQQMVLDDNFELGAVLSAYKAALLEQGLSSTDYERYLEHGKKIITQLFNKYDLDLQKTGQPEVSLRTRINDVTLGGKLDRVDKNGTELLISDYKTGKPLSSLQTKSQALQQKAWRHRTQLELYILMAKESGNYPGAKTIAAQMTYVEAETKKDLTLRHEASAEELDRLQRLIVVVNQKIQTLNLPDVRHYEASYNGTRQFEEDLLSGVI
jgi:DNA helicase-2/ATP-dependent DNA helicase PcrA